uniref:Prefoldin subunit 4 n=1 Tax=Polytomella parva TaxID=51329 RepID=A0A7S0V407_9CHLO|mmetsp:Transcript_30002/g.54867  ORF Transcript_30002/g.54867 Transcript_30002/m.54867 type:complete len:130 (+) Transcript_30002:33-422(+)|eukprot:CAMPEP_0175067162 /NCGR_PEP_ID=MMETSP0052_2-20121109/16935_1 /TAXON_ID=51329 ORGANISM="Polytomella parva, Strain SAG 63-3" /NCGR_SAMPLE_ID=MMETSP0052_2 /ASSEMBLY_ACC=CAM_ASM_000194 /LENGTH=129 /DNA_ID=CAMNT_0016333993 /DNA_START=33 /DNA_END=422 /DNA_ORIENTATION=-
MSKEAKSVEVLLEDQQRINTFNKLNTKKYQLEASIVKIKKILEDLEDAGNELMLSDDENVRMMSGECFIHHSKETVEQKLEELVEKGKKDLENTENELQELLNSLAALKKVLYAKFGDSINLEENPQAK